MLDRFLSPISFQYPKAITQSGWLEHGPFAAWVVEATQPKLLVELGSHWGYSFFAFCQAVDSLGLETRCIAVDTWAGDEHAGFYDNSVFKYVETTANREYPAFTTLLRKRFDEAVHDFADRSIDLLHIDGRHFYEDALEDFELYLPKVSDCGVVLIHDITERQEGFGVWQLWEEISARFPTFAFHHGHGLGIVAVGANVPEPIRRLTSLQSDGQEADLVRRMYSQLGQAISGADGVRRAEQFEIRLHEAGSRHAIEIKAADARVAQYEGLVDRALQHSRSIVQQSEAREVSLMGQLRDLEGKLRQARRPTARRFLGMVRAELRARGDRLLGSDRPDERTLALLSDLFDPDYYATQHPEAAGTGHGLFTHYLRHGWVQRESPTPLFDPDWYQRKYPDVAASGVAPLDHFLTDGDRENRDPNAVFDTSWYRSHHGHEFPASDNALVHFVKHGDRLGYNPSPAFWTDWYRDRYPEVAASRIALSDYLSGGARRGRDPHPDFDTSWYMVNNPDVVAAQVNPLVHYLTHGLDEGRASNAAGARLCDN